ncbi:MAG TPA: MarR family transcriptional regulator [Bryobacteraceae bacterium]|nr:MarR family transcriptional regulator [Bryobacteraceae bacterium]
MQRTGGETCRRPPAAFLLAQVGAHAAAQFGARLVELKLAPAQAGMLRILGSRPAITQQALANALGMVPSRLVALVDELEARGLVERRANPQDRRSHAMHLSEKGRSTLQAVGRIAREHQQALLAALSEDEQLQLTSLLQRIADKEGLTPGVHPGYARLGEKPPRRR